MSKIHTVIQGEYLALIAEQYRLANWRMIYDHPDNAEFRRLRPNPDLIYPGDKIVIPNLENKVEQCNTEVKHRFQRSVSSDQLCIKLLDSDDQPLACLPYKLTFGDEDGHEDDHNVPGKRTSADGVVEQPIPRGARCATLKIWGQQNDNEPTCHWKLQIGNLDPLPYIHGIQERLNNLGFDCGPVDGVDGPMTKAGVKAFQKKHKKLAIDGIAGPKTQEKLINIYGC